MRKATALRQVAASGIAGLLLALTSLSGISSATTVSSGYLHFSGYGGDYISLDQTWSYDPSNSVMDATASVDANQLQLNINAGTFWTLVMQAPQGEALMPGLYDGATRWPFQSPTDPGLSLFGDGRGCNTSTGSFTVLDAQFGPNGWVERFHATFEQHCEGDPNSAAVGEVLIDNGVPPTPLDVTVTTSAKGWVSRVTGAVSLSGTISCSKETTADLSGIVTQRASRYVVVTGSWGSSVPCSATATRWEAVVWSDSGVPFNPKAAQSDVTATAWDPEYQEFTSSSSSTIVRLTRS